MKSLHFAFALSILGFGPALVGCGGPGGDGSLGEDATLSAIIEGWSRGTGYAVQARVAGSSTPGEVSASAPIDTNGTFSLALPKGETFAHKLEPVVFSTKPECSSTPSVDPAGLKSARLTFWVVAPDASPVPLHIDGPAGGTDASNLGVQAKIVYADRDARITGQFDCFASSVRNEFAESLRLGWNVTIIKSSRYPRDDGSAIAVTESSTGPLTPAFKWHAID